MIKIEKLRKSVGAFTLKDISLEVDEGQYFVLLGPTGAGKSLLLDVVSGLLKADSGRIFLRGVDVTAMPPEGRSIGYMFQQPSLFPHLTVEDNILYGLKRKGMSRQQMKRRLSELADVFGINHLLNRKIKGLSGGEAQKVSFARTLAPYPELLLLDEPLSSLDPTTSNLMIEKIKSLRKDFMKTTIHVTHDFDEAMALAERIGVLNEGELVQTGSPEEIFRKPKSEFVAKFSLARNVFMTEIADAEGGVGVGMVGKARIYSVTKKRGKCYLSVRPEDVIISRGEISTSALNTFRGNVVKIERKGSVVFVSVDVPPVFVSMITYRSLNEMGLREGDSVTIAFKASAVWVF